MRDVGRIVCRGGVTLVEMLVAVSVTVVMLLAVGMVFRSATEAAGLGLASNEVMGQLRAVTGQLDKDFRGLRADMPMAIIFEIDPCDPCGIRYDRISFFANGDFQMPVPAGRVKPGFSAPTVSGNVARIFYGQSDDAAAVLETQDPCDYRRILTRRTKIITSDGRLVPAFPEGSGLTGISYEFYDSVPYETTGLSFWKGEPFTDFRDYYFRTSRTAAESVGSLVRRVHVGAIMNAIAARQIDRGALQGLYFLPDVADFRVQVWLGESTSGFPLMGNRWFPTEQDMLPINFGSAFAFYWNVPDLGAAPPEPINGIGWWADEEVSFIWPDPRPRALRFTFTVYDDGRRHYPEGRTFSYVVRIGDG